MPNLPYSRAADKTAVFEDSGAAILIELGQYLVDVGGHGHTALRGGSRPSSESIEETLDSFRERLDRHFGSHPKAGMRRYVVAREGRGKGKVDFRAAKAVGVLAALHVREGQDSVPIFKVAALATPDAMPQDILEMRRLIAALGIDEVVEVSELRGLWHPSVRLSPRAMQSLYGGAQAIPIVSTGSLAAARRAMGKDGAKSPAPAAQPKGAKGDIRSYVACLPDLTPEQMSDMLDLRGFVNQERARRTLCLAGFRHIGRLRKIFIEGAKPAEIPQKENILVRGPTGSGKTMLAEALFRDTLSLPFALVDITGYSEAGYVGGDVSTIPCSLISAAGSLPLSEIGVLVLDEIDKIADASGAQRQMVSRHGVQRQLLLMLQGGTLEVPEESGVHPMRALRVPWRSHNVLFIGLGAFADWNRLCGVRKPIGFSLHEGGGGGAATAEASDTDGYHKYGLTPELVGRLPVVVEFQALSQAELREILELNVITAYTHELELDDIELEVDADAVDVLLDRAVARKSGARGLQGAMVEALEEGCYRVYSTKGRNRMLRLYAEDGQILWEVTKQRTRRTRASEAGQIELPEGLEMLGTGTDV